MKLSTRLEQWRTRSGAFASATGDEFGAFDVPGPCGSDLQVIASCGDSAMGIPWEHVSVSLPRRTPNWLEMCFIKNLFWDDEEAVMQLHPPKSTWINNHDYCLHLWKPTETDIPLPPGISVGIKELGTLKAREREERAVEEASNPSGEELR